MKAVQSIKGKKKVRSGKAELSINGRLKKDKKAKAEFIKETEKAIERKKEIEAVELPEISSTDKKITPEDYSQEVITNEDEQFQITNNNKAYRLGEEQNLIKRIRVGSLF